MQAKKRENKADSQNSEEKTIFFLIAATFLVIIIFVSYSLFLGRNPEGFSQVYLEKDYQSKIQDGKITFSFFIESSEAKALDYNYSISVNGSPSKKGSINIKPGEKKEIRQSLNLDVFSVSPLKVTVGVQKQDYKEPYLLWFWVSR